jgi:hypothetical protein
MAIKKKSKGRAQGKLTVTYKGESFLVTSSQKRAFEGLPRNLKSKLSLPNGKPLKASDLKDLGKAVELLKKHKEVASTVMCPW